MAYVRAAEREQQIVAAAIDVLGTVGVPGTTLRMVAARAGVPLGTLHYVFPSKDQLLRAVVTTVLDGVGAVFRASLELDRGLEHALRQGAASLWDVVVADDIGLQIMQYELTMWSARADDDHDLARFTIESYTSLLAELCEEAATTAGETCAVDFPTLGRLLLAVLDGLVIQLVAGRDPARSRRDLDHAVDMLVGYVRP